MPHFDSPDEKHVPISLDGPAPAKRRKQFVPTPDAPDWATTTARNEYILLISHADASSAEEIHMNRREYKKLKYKLAKMRGHLQEVESTTDKAKGEGNA